MTDKFLPDCRGAKEGTDGLITSALDRAPHARAHAHRVPGVLWFAKEAVPTSSKSKTSCLPSKSAGVLLAGLEHLDDRYLKAVGYATKSKKGGGLPKMVLIGDIAGDDPMPWRAPTPRWCASPTRATARALRPSARGAQEVLADRKKTAAISRHTNAFKINEDVVIPLPRMAEYTDGIERINIELSLRNKSNCAIESSLPRRAAAGQARRRDIRPSLLG